MFISPRFTGNPPQRQQQPQQTRRPAPIYPEGYTPPKAADKKQTEAEQAPETAPVPVPDFSADAQGNICPFQNAVASDGTSTTPQKILDGQAFQQARVHRNGCYYLTRPDGKFEYDDRNYYNSSKGREFKKGDVVDLDNVG